MEKIKLIRVTQFSLDFYIGVWDPRKLVRIADQDVLKSDAIPEAQRPIDKKHLKEIAEYVGKKESGTLPATVIISTKDKNKLSVQREDVNGEKQYYINLPSSEEELASCGPLIDVIDGQHRLFAFHKDYIDTNIKDEDVFLMPFSIFETPMLRTRQSLFLVTNEKQKSVNPNLLLFLREKLNLLDEDEKTYYPLIKKLAEENVSPLKGRIIMSAEKIKKGLKSKEILKILKKAKFTNTAKRTGCDVTSDKFLKILADYLSGWERYYGINLNAQSESTITKISGLRYILFMFDTFLERYISDFRTNNSLRFDAEYVKTMVAKLEEMKKEKADASWRENDTLFTCDAYRLGFRGEGATVTMAQNDQGDFRDYLNRQIGGLNPFQD